MENPTATSVTLHRLDASPRDYKTRALFTKSAPGASASLGSYLANLNGAERLWGYITFFRPGRRASP
jgi:hypothetical protein